MLGTVWTSLPTSSIGRKRKGQQVDDGNSKTGVRTRAAPMSACTICYSHKSRCSGDRPCQRCSRMGCVDLCKDRNWGQPRSKPSSTTSIASLQLLQQHSSMPSSSLIAHSIPSPSVVVATPITASDAPLTLSPLGHHGIGGAMVGIDAVSDLNHVDADPLPLNNFEWLATTPIATHDIFEGAIVTTSTNASLLTLTSPSASSSSSSISSIDELLYGVKEETSSIWKRERGLHNGHDSKELVSRNEVIKILHDNNGTITRREWHVPPSQLYPLTRDEASVARTALHNLVPWIRDIISSSPPVMTTKYTSFHPPSYLLLILACCCLLLLLLFLICYLIWLMVC
jgi:hypothetical protein